MSQDVQSSPDDHWRGCYSYQYNQLGVHASRHKPSSCTLSGYTLRQFVRAVSDLLA